MKKKPARQSAPVSPEQTAALRRLAKAGRGEEALERLDRLIAQHPDFKPLYGLGWEIASLSGLSHQVTLRAYEWTRASPNSRAAWQALVEDAMASGHIALALEAQRRSAELEGKPISLPETIDTPFGPLPFPAALANDIGRLYMANSRFDEALAALSGFDAIPNRNNTALILFHRGESEKALAMFEETWQREPRNLFSLGQIVRLRLWRNGLDFAAGLAAPLRQTPAERSDDALAKITALLLLQDWQSADAAWREAAATDFWNSPEKTAEKAEFDWAGAIAAWHLGDLDAMRERLAAACVAQPEWQAEADMALVGAQAPVDLGLAPDLALGEFHHWFPQTLTDRLRKEVQRSDDALETRLSAMLDDCDVHVDYLAAAALLGGEKTRFFALTFLKNRARTGNEAARATLIDLLARPCGPDSVRSNLHLDLIELGLIPKDSTVKMLAGGQVRDIRPLTMNIHAEPSPSNLPPQSHAELEKIFDLLAKGKLSACLPILEKLIERHPDNAMLYHNLASIKEGLGHPESEIEGLQEKSYALDPDYLFARAGLARAAIRRGDIERGKELLAPLLEKQSYHYTEWRSILLTQIELAKAEGEFGAALRMGMQLAQLEEEFGKRK